MSALPYLSRRSLFASATAAVGVTGAAPAALAAPSVPSLPAADPLDAALIAAAEEVRWTWDEENRLANLPKYELDSPEELAIEAQVLALVNRRDDAVEAATKIPARTYDGLRAKADIVWRCLPAAFAYQLDEDFDVMRLIMSLAKDLRGEA